MKVIHMQPEPHENTQAFATTLRSLSEEELLVLEWCVADAGGIQTLDSHVIRFHEMIKEPLVDKDVHDDATLLHWPETRITVAQAIMYAENFCRLGLWREIGSAPYADERRFKFTALGVVFVNATNGA